MEPLDDGVPVVLLSPQREVLRELVVRTWGALVTEAARFSGSAVLVWLEQDGLLWRLPDDGTGWGSLLRCVGDVRIVVHTNDSVREEKWGPIRPWPDSNLDTQDNKDAELAVKPFVSGTTAVSELPRSIVKKTANRFCPMAALPVDVQELRDGDEVLGSRASETGDDLLFLCSRSGEHTIAADEDDGRLDDPASVGEEAHYLMEGKVLSHEPHSLERLIALGGGDSAKVRRMLSVLPDSQKIPSPLPL
jgi:hypothetical protein